MLSEDHLQVLDIGHHFSSATVRRLPARASYDADVINAILDEGVVAHVGFVEDGRPSVIPMVYARDGDRILLHGSPASRIQRALRSGASICGAFELPVSSV